MQTITSTLIIILEALGSAILSLLIYYGQQWIRVHITQTTDSNILLILQQLDNIIMSAVTSTQNTVVDDLKEQGQFTAEAQKQVLQSTTQAVLQAIPLNVVAQFKDAGINLQQLIHDKIEQSVYQLKMAPEETDSDDRD